MDSRTPTYKDPWVYRCVVMVRCGTPRMGRCTNTKAFGDFCTYHAVHRPLGAHEPRLADGAAILNPKLVEVRSQLKEIAMNDLALPETRAMILMQIRSEVNDLIKELKD